MSLSDAAAKEDSLTLKFEYLDKKSSEENGRKVYEVTFDDASKEGGDDSDDSAQSNADPHNSIELINQSQKNKRDTRLTNIGIHFNQTFIRCKYLLEDSNSCGCTNGSAVEQGHFGLRQRTTLLSSTNNQKESIFVAEEGESDVLLGGFNTLTEGMTKLGGEAMSDNEPLLSYVSKVFIFPDYMSPSRENTLVTLMIH